MTEKPQARLRPLEIRDVEAVAAYEREIAKISFPDDPITDLGFYVKKVRRLVDDRGAATSSPRTIPASSDGLTSASGRISSPRSPTRTSTAFSSARRSAAPGRWESWWTPCSTIVDARSSTASCSGPAPPMNR